MNRVSSHDLLQLFRGEPSFFIYEIFVEVGNLWSFNLFTLSQFIAVGETTFEHFESWNFQIHRWRKWEEIKIIESIERIQEIIVDLSKIGFIKNFHGMRRSKQTVADDYLFKKIERFIKLHIRIKTL